MSGSKTMLRFSAKFGFLFALSCSLSVRAWAQDDTGSEETKTPATEIAPTPAPVQPPAQPKQPRSKQNRQRQLKSNQQQQAQNQSQGQSQTSSVFFPDWTPNKFESDLRPVLGIEYFQEPKNDTTALLSELGAYFAVRGIPLVEGNPGLQLEPAIGYAWGYAVVKGAGLSAETGSFRRGWGSLRTPIYYKFIRQVFEGKYGEVFGGPLLPAKRASFQSDTGVLVVPHVSAHYTLTYERAYGEDSKSPELRSYDHWIHGRFSASTLNFFIDVGPGYSASKSSLNLGTQGQVEGKTSGAYLLGVSGFDLLADKVGFEASSKYMFSSQTDVDFFGAVGRSPLEDLGAQAALTGLPADSLHASAFFGIRRLVGAFGIGWRYSLQILNFSEANNTKQQKTETNGLGVYASVRL